MRSRSVLIGLAMAHALWPAAAGADLLSLTDYHALTQVHAGQGSNEDGDKYGSAMAAGDFDGDGYVDLAVGAEGEDVDGKDDAGAVFVFWGSGGGLLGFGGDSSRYYVPRDDAFDQGEKVPNASVEAGDAFGAALAAGDFDDDGFDDLAVGSPGEKPGSDGRSGEAHVFFGSKLRTRIENSDTGGHGGLVFGRALTQRTAEILGQTNADGDRFGAALAAGDFDGDGSDDLAVGAPSDRPNGGPPSGSVFVFFGHASFDSPSNVPMTRLVLQPSNGNEANDQFGRAVAAGDFDGDGDAELAVGAPGESSGTAANAGAVFVFRKTQNLGLVGLGSAVTLAQAGAGGTDETNDKFGSALAVGDFNGDDRFDLAVGAPGEDGAAGRMFHFHGSEAGLADGQSRAQGTAGDQFGFSIAAGDLNGDGKDDIVVGAPNARPESAASGAAYAFAGSANGIGAGGLRIDQARIGSAAREAGDNEAGDDFAKALTVADFNGDGAADLAIGAPGEAPWSDGRSGSVLVNAGSSVTPRITHGGLLGAVTDCSIKIWARSDRAAGIAVRYRKLDGGGWATSEKVVVRAIEDFTGVVKLGGDCRNSKAKPLEPATRYEYEVLVDGGEQPAPAAKVEPARIAPFPTFRTLPSRGQVGGSVLTFAIGGDSGFELHPFPIFDHIRAVRPDFMIWSGDQIYIDGGVNRLHESRCRGSRCMPSRKAVYEREYKAIWGERHIRKFLRVVPSFMIWDDHEIINNWHSQYDPDDDGLASDPFADAKAAYDEYQRSHSPVAKPVETAEERRRIHYSFTAGDADFFVLDVRSYRSANGAADNAGKTMLGGSQKAALINWAKSSDAPFKFIVSAVPWRRNRGSDGKLRDDAWAGFQTEKNEIFRELEGIPGVFLISGDQHYATIHRLGCNGEKPGNDGHLYEFNATPTGIWPLKKSLWYTAADGVAVHEYNATRAFGLFRVDTTKSPAELRYELYDDRGQTVNTGLPQPLEPSDSKSVCN